MYTALYEVSLEQKGIFSGPTANMSTPTYIRVRFRTHRH